MWIKYCVLASCLVTISLAAEEPSSKKKDDRGKRNLEYSISHHYSGPTSYRADRRISTGSQLPLYQNPQFFPGPRPYTSFRKGRPYSLPPPPYAVQMEPLIQYSQKDPLYDSNIFSLNTDGHNDLATDTNHIHENIYGPPQHKIIERPVYIKEPEPIIEIIIKESNVTLPPLPTTPPPKKKKEEVQVFYVKYKKNKNGHGKDSVIYDKPVPAISPHIHDDEEEDNHHNQYQHHEVATLPPPPSTTLRTIIKPDSEIYHSPSGIKVTFGKEGFDYSKRSKYSDIQHHQQQHASEPSQSVQFPQGRQLSSFPTYQKRAPVSNYNFQSNSNNFNSERIPQPYRPFNAPPSFKQPPPPSFARQPPSQSSPSFASQPKYPFQQPPYVKPPGPSFPQPQFSRPPSPPSFNPPSNGSPYPQFPQSPSNPPPPTFQTPRQPVPYKPFESIRSQPPQPAPQPQPSFQHNSQPLQQSQPSFQQSSFKSQQPAFAHHPLPSPSQHQQPQSPQPTSPVFPQFNQQHQNRIQFRPETHFPSQQQLPLNQQPSVFNQQQIQHQNQQEFSQQQQQVQQNNNQNEHLLNLQHAQNVLPPGGELVQSLPKYEQHFSIVEPGNNQQPQNLPLQSSQPQQNQQSHLTPEQYNQKIQQQFSSPSLQNVEVQQRGNNQFAESKPVQSSQQQSLQQHNLQQQSLQQQALQQSLQQQSLQQQPLQQQSLQQQALQQQFYQQSLQNVEHNLFTSPRSTTVYKTTRQPSTTPRVFYQSTTQATTTTTEEAVTPSTTTKDPKILEAQLPDEVPEDLRAQLLSSGILNNADISILDYDKVGDIPLSALPPDQLANFYNAGGASQISSGSEPVPSVVNLEGKKVKNSNVDLDSAGSDIEEVKAKAPVEMKVVRYDPETDKGQKVQESYVSEDATQLDPVVLNDSSYNRYLPLKVNGTQFPIPDVPELKGKKISSVVVLAPVAYDFSSQRKTRNAETKDDIDLIQGEALKTLLNNPTLENYKKFLENENKTRADKQAVILLVTGSEDVKKNEKEIFMYDIATKTVSKLSGELSSAFVEAAEANAEKDAEDSKVAASNIVETRVPFSGEVDRNDNIDDFETSASEFVESKIPIIDPMQGDLDTEASEQLESFVDFSGRALNHDDLLVSASEVKSKSNQVSINSGYSKTGNS